jgi:hypothetical protein
MLTYGRDQTLMVDTLEDAARWGIDLVGGRKRWKVSRNMLVQACFNFQAWVNDEKAERIDFSNKYSPKPNPVKFTKDSQDATFYKVWVAELVDHYCLLSAVDGREETYLQICSVNDFNGVHHGRCPDYGMIVPAYYGLPPDTPIRSLK